MQEISQMRNYPDRERVVGRMITGGGSLLCPAAGINTPITAKTMQLLVNMTASIKVPNRSDKLNPYLARQLSYVGYFGSPPQGRL
jgi:hypothetical protein